MNNSTNFRYTRQMLVSQYAMFDAPVAKTEVLATGQNNRYLNPNLQRGMKGYSHSFLVNLKAIEARKAGAVDAAFGDNDSCDAKALNNLTFVHEIIVREGQKDPELPSANEEVTLGLKWASKVDENDEVYYIEDRDGQRILNVVAGTFKVKPAVKSKGFSFGGAVQTEANANIGEEHVAEAPVKAEAKATAAPKDLF